MTFAFSSKKPWNEKLWGFLLTGRAGTGRTNGELDQRGWIWYAAQGVGKFIAALRLTGVGFFIGGSIALGVFVGLWADRKFNTEPILVIVGLLLGVLVAFYGVYQMLLPLVRGKQDKENS